MPIRWVDSRKEWLLAPNGARKEVCVRIGAERQWKAIRSRGPSVAKNCPKRHQERMQSAGVQESGAKLYYLPKQATVPSLRLM